MTGQADFVSYVDSQRERYLDLFFRLLRQPSISAQKVGVAECAALLRDLMGELGIQGEVLPTAEQPVVFGEVGTDPSAPTVLIYGHYDVQPPEPYEAWISPPFEPTVRDGRVYARGAADNKGQLLAHLFAVHALREVGALPKLNYKFIFDGEEETGSPSLPAFVEANPERLRADVMVGSDGHYDPSGRPAVRLGVRGILFVELECQWANRDLHSGQFGNVVPNPAWTMIQLLAGMKDAEGRVAIPGYYDAVVPPTEYERQLMAAIPHDEARWLQGVGLPGEMAVSTVEHFERLMFRPTLNVAGFNSGYAGEGVKTVLPARARVKIDMRLVKDQDPQDIFEKFSRFVAERAPEVTVRILGGPVPPSRTSPELPVVQAILGAVRESWGAEPVIYPSSGGTLPLFPFTRTLGVPVVFVPFGNPDETNHSPNENLVLADFFRGIRTSAAILGGLAKLDRADFKAGKGPTQSTQSR